MKKVLIADDEPAKRIILGSVFDTMPDKVTVLYAFTILEAKAVFDTNPDIDLIALDACMPLPETRGLDRYRPNTMPLAQYFRSQHFEGVMVAVSREDAFNQLLLKAGCDHACNKEDFAKIALKLLGL